MAWVRWGFRPPNWTRSGGSRHSHSSCSDTMKISACRRRLRLVQLAMAAKTFPRARSSLLSARKTPREPLRRCVIL
jgi:hypothetical protein